MTTDNGAVLGKLHYRVTLTDGSVLIAHVWNVDMVRWDRTAAKHGWPAYDRAPMMFATFLAWAALKRTEQIADTWETFADERCAIVTAIDADGNDLTDTDAGEAPTDAVDPIRLAVGRG